MADMFGIHERALLLHAKRTGVIAENISNADTPSFKAKDLDFKSVLQGQSKQIHLNKTSGGHIEMKRSAGVRFVNPSAPSLDGNTVDIESEKLKLVEAQQMYNTSFQFLDGAIKSKMQVIKGE